MNILAIFIFFVVLGFILYKGYKLIFSKKQPKTPGTGKSTGVGGDEGERTWTSQQDDPKNKGEV
jgi:hypothetical protein